MRGFHLGSQSLWIDELFTVGSSGVGAPLHLADLVENIHGALYSLVLHVCSQIAGDSEWGLRLPSALFGVALVPAMAVLANEWVGREAVKPAAWLTALSPFLVWYSQETRNYMLLILCGCLSAVTMLRLRRHPAPGAAAAWLGTAWAGLMSGFSFVLLAPIELEWWLTSKTTLRRRLAGAAIGGAVLLVLVSPWILRAARTWDFQRLGPGANAGAAIALRGHTTFHPGAIPFALHALAVGYTLGPALRELRTGDPAATLSRHGGELMAVALVFGALGVAGLAALRRRGRLLETALWLVVPMLLVCFVALRNFKPFNPRYLAVCMPAFLLVLAAGLADLRRRWAIAFALAIAVLWGISLAQHYFVPAYGKEDYRGAAALVDRQGREGERVLALGAVEPLFYYYRGSLPGGSLWLGYASNPTLLESKVAGALAGARGAWVVLSRPEDLDPGGAFAGWMALRFPRAARAQFEGVWVWHLERDDVEQLEAAAGH